MDMPKLLIADHDEVFRQCLADALAGICSVRTCATGKQALEQLQAFRPELMVVDLLLPEIDGISLLHRAAELQLCPAVVATTRFTSPYVTSALARLEVSMVLTKPCDIQGLAEHVKDLAAEMEPAPISQADMRSAVSNLLLNLGFSTKLDGFNYLQAGIPLFAEDPSQPVTKELYKTVGDLYNKSSDQVERSIRTAIKKAWLQGSQEIWHEYFPTPPNVPVPRPSNREFISRMAHHLSAQMFGWQTA